LAFEDEAAVEEALFNWQENRCGFSDCLIMAHNRQLGCRSTVTFDARAVRLPGASEV
jgi:predicted nucleic-acid-binding protein